MSQKYMFVEREGIRAESSPAIFVYYDGVFYPFDGNRTSIGPLIFFMNRLVTPLLSLETEQDLLNFLELSNEPNETTKFLSKSQLKMGSEYTDRQVKTRVVAFIYDKDDFKEELRVLRQSSRSSARRDDLRVGIVTDRKVIKKYKQKYGTAWFPEVSYSSLVLKRYDGETFSYDFLNESPINTPYFWINK